jgi:hypothetical protein
MYNIRILNCGEGQAMAALEQELMRKFKGLNESQQREVLDFVSKLKKRKKRHLTCRTG